MNRKKAFTLIELLIVVAIIGILAAIAVPNFLSAQTRAKISRTLADMRALRLACATYYIDNNSFPDAETGVKIPPDSHTRLEELTSPIAYMNSIPYDPFNPRESNSGIAVHEYVYFTREIWAGSPEAFEMVVSGYNCENPSSAFYFIFGLGPDFDCDFGTGPYTPKGIITYDPTNGTISNGDVATFGP